MQLTQMLITLVISFSITVITMPICIGYFRIHNEGQTIRDEGPRWHIKKNGTPTMGGIIFLISTILVSFLTCFILHKINSNFFMIIFIMIVYGIVGFLDDSIKILHKQNLGLNAKQKLFGQILGGVLFLILYFYYKGSPEINFGIFITNSYFIYVIFSLFWIVGFSNAVNLTDGLDGLVAGLAIISFLTYSFISYIQHQYCILLICLALSGALLGFLFFNHKPAKIFMGDVGSLSLGGTLAVISLLLHREFSLLFIGIIYIIETLSVILQVTYFKITGKRLFKMSPIHHHFEMLGWSEWQIDIVFWLISIIFSLIYLYFFIK